MRRCKNATITSLSGEVIQLISKVCSDVATHIIAITIAIIATATILSKLA